MTFSQIGDIVNSTGLPNVYDHFTTSPAPPYVVFTTPTQNDFHADNENYCGKTWVYIELFVEKRDFTSEGKIETALRNAGLSWFKSVDYLNDENIYQTTYETEVIING